MKQEGRRKKIDAILDEVKKKVEYPSIRPEMWVVAQEGKPGEPEFEKWLRICTQMVDNYLAETGERDSDSIFAQFVRKYGRRKYEK